MSILFAIANLLKYLFIVKNSVFLSIIKFIQQFLQYQNILSWFLT